MKTISKKNRTSRFVSFSINHKSVSIDMTFEQDEKNMNGGFINFWYHHPLTNQRCQELTQVFSGWSEQNEDMNKEWSELQLFLNNEEKMNAILDDLFWSDSHNNEFDTIDYD
jgi:hypothetical protein